MYHGFIDVPPLSYYEFGNVWTGSLLGDFNYKIEPHSKDEPPVLAAYYWYGEKCFEMSECENFIEGFSEAGYQRIIDKLNEKIKAYRNGLYGLDS
ncbi:MAG: hypothetical protein LUE12_04365 [Ruminococcus sp.]|nr:hypothetical protein [Ruminococcus sp.]